MKITLLAVENYKRIKSIAIEPTDRHLILIGGKNRQGKSSLLGAMSAALGGKKHAADQPVRDGERAAEIRIELDGGDLIVRRRFTDGGSTTLEVKDRDGTLRSPQKVLNKMIGSRFLDPLKFSRLAEKAQRDALLGCVYLPFDLEKHDRKRDATFQARTDINRDVKSLRAQLDALPEIEVPAAVDIAEETSRLAELTTRQSNLAAARARAEATGVQIEALKRRIQALREELAGAEAALDAALKEPGPADDPADLATQIEELRLTIANAGEQNQAAADGRSHMKRRAEVAEKLAEAERAAADLTTRIDAMDQTKRDELARCNMPIAGLSISDDGVCFNDLPLSQASGAEQLQVSLAIAAAMSPNLRDIWVEDGALLDDDSVELMRRYAEENDLRIWLERVGEGDAEAVILQDGQIKEA